MTRMKWMYEVNNVIVTLVRVDGDKRPRVQSHKEMVTFLEGTDVKRNCAAQKLMAEDYDDEEREVQPDLQLITQQHLTVDTPAWTASYTNTSNAMARRRMTRVNPSHDAGTVHAYAQDDICHRGTMSRSLNKNMISYT